MNCNIVLHPYCRGWIIEKLAFRLNDALKHMGVNCAVSDSHAPDADINHFMIFHYVDGSRTSKNTMGITHVDDALKVRMIKDSLGIIDVGICMSGMTVKSLVDQGVPRDRLCYISPAHDGNVTPRRVRIGITSNLHSDGRKREALLTRLAKEMDLRDFHFDIFGKGWSKICEQLRAGGATVALDEGTFDWQADYTEMCRRIREFDFYLYPGLDEGSLGTLDALAAGVPTIITPQGFHLDIPQGITHPFWDYAELKEIFEDIAMPRRCRIQSATALTWAEYARKHVLVWQSLLEGRQTEFPVILRQGDFGNGGLSRAGQRTVLQRVAGYTKLANRYRWNMLKRYYAPKVRQLFARRTVKAELK